ncbi:MAG: hypothetical protein A3G77_15150 [Acidobacteria bacterium RIFCSPLOWO2_12_FULL_68_19]|nr:MAG: hypothetical protein A3G77_15150 [Acidobacteria bacterium RIFCSPLOWO2_12_FULL_68_19]
MTPGQRRPWRAAAAALALATVTAACGKKGVPIPPPLRIPAPVETIAAVRLGNDVYVTLTVPATNIDTSIPIDIGRIDVYGYTGRLPPTRLRWAELGTVVASFDIPPVPLDYKPPAPQVAATLPTSAMPGTPVTVRDALTPDEFEQGPVWVDPRQRNVPVPLPAAAVPAVTRRFYLAIPFSRRGRPGPPGAQAELVLTSLPDPPTDLRAAYSPGAVALSWGPSGGLFGFLLDRSLPPEPLPFVPPSPPGAAAAPPPVVDTSVPPGPTSYNVYREVAPDPLALPSGSARRTPPGITAVPMPISPAPIAATSASDVQIAFDRTHCYVVRAQRGSVLSEPSSPACVTPIDVFPPAAPSGLAAVPSEGGISLIWEPNSELDLGGYLVLRREPGDATLRQLTEAPVAEARFRDAAVEPGRRYLYSVVAVDNRLPLPNVSAESAPVEETAR